LYEDQKKRGMAGEEWWYAMIGTKINKRRKNEISI